MHRARRRPRRLSVPPRPAAGKWEKQPVVASQEAMTILDRSYDHTRQVLHRLARRRWLATITAGKHGLIPAERCGQNETVAAKFAERERTC